MLRMKTSSAGKLTWEFLQVLAGNIICAFSMVCFALPYKMVVSGVSGIGRIVDYFTGFGVTQTVAVINAALFIIGFLVFGKKYAASIVVGCFAFPFFMAVFDRFEMLHHMVSEPMLAAVCAGVLDGIGLGLVLRVGGSTGGIDVPAMILNRKFGIKAATVLMVLDITIFVLQIPITSAEGVILGILYTLVYALVLDRIIVMSQGGYQMMIWTDKVGEVNEKLLSMRYGTTLIKAQGGYLRDHRDIILCAMNTRDLGRAKRTVLDIDNKAFITITSMNEVNGNGFTYKIEGEDYVEEFGDRHEAVTEKRIP